MLGIAISVYDKFEELRLLLDVLRENFRTPFVVAVCSNSERAAAELGLVRDSRRTLRRWAGRLVGRPVGPTLYRHPDSAWFDRTEP